MSKLKMLTILETLFIPDWNTTAQVCEEGVIYIALQQGRYYTKEEFLNSDMCNGMISDFKNNRLNLFNEVEEYYIQKYIGFNDKVIESKYFTQSMFLGDVEKKVEAILSNDRNSFLSIKEAPKTKLNNLFIEALKRAGYIFKSIDEVESFIKNRCKAVKSLMSNTTTYYVDEKPFLHEEHDRSSSKWFLIDKPR